MPPRKTSSASGNNILVTLLVCAKFPSEPGGLSPSLPHCLQDGGLEAGAVAACCSSPATRGCHAEDQRLQHQGVWGQQDVQPDYRRYHRLCECWGREAVLATLVSGMQPAWGSQTLVFFRHLSIHVSICASTHPSIHLSTHPHSSPYAPIRPPIHLSVHPSMIPSTHTSIHSSLPPSVHTSALPPISISNLGPSPLFPVLSQEWVMLGAAQVPHVEQPASEELLGWWVVGRWVLEGTVSPQGSFKTENTGISRGAPSLGSWVPATCPCFQPGSFHSPAQAPMGASTSSSQPGVSSSELVPPDPVGV